MPWVAIAVILVVVRVGTMVLFFRKRPNMVVSKGDGDAGAPATFRCGRLRGLRWLPYPLQFTAVGGDSVFVSSMIGASEPAEDELEKGRYQWAAGTRVARGRTPLGFPFYRLPYGSESVVIWSHPWARAKVESSLRLTPLEADE